MHGRIARIARLRMGTDGKGISTLVIMKKCHLKCRYCINESYALDDDEYANFTPEDLVNELIVDDIYFKMTGGGVVFGGGEPLLQSDFIKQACLLMDKDWAIRVETSLNVPWENIHILIPYMTSWIIDIKDMNPNIYHNYTGADNQLVMDNLLKLSKLVSTDRLCVRVPHISNYNVDADVKASKSFLENLGIIDIDEFRYEET